MIKVLVADDDPVTRELLGRNIQKWGYKVIQAENGNAAWRILQKKVVSMAVLDWMMSGINGVELCRKVRSNKKAQYVYLILLTSRNSRQDILEGLSSGADDYMTKPVHLAELKARLQTGTRILQLEGDLLRVKRTLQKLAFFDSVTSVWNRRKILEFLKEELARGQRENHPTSVILLDVDHFKKINDRYGHPSGDTVLAEIAKRMKKTVRPYDRVGRFGGDELMAIVMNCGRTQAREVAERIRKEIGGRKFRTARGMVEVRASLGVVSTQGLPETPTPGLIQFADQALYRAKRTGRNATVLYPF